MPSGPIAFHRRFELWKVVPGFLFGLLSLWLLLSDGFLVGLPCSCQFARFGLGLLALLLAPLAVWALPYLFDPTPISAQ